jgi:GNAT superfamily N-acetyltransferase
MKISELIVEKVSTDFFNRPEDEPYIPPTKNVRMGDFEFNARSFTGALGDQNAQGLQIRAYDPKRPKGSGSIGSADFIMKTDKRGNAWLESDDTEVDEEYRGKGVATMMYAFAKSLGNDIRRSPFQSKAGSNMWNKWGKDAKHLGEAPISLPPTSQPAKSWIEKVYAKYPQTWQNNHVMPLGDEQFAMFELVPSLSKRGAVEVKWFQAYPLRQGIGSRAMQELQAMAREDGISLTLYPWDKGQVSQSKLTKFYRGHGFTPSQKGGKSMQWSPVEEVPGNVKSN